MSRKEQYADELIREMEANRRGCWADHIDERTKNDVIRVCMNIIESWCGRGRDHIMDPDKEVRKPQNDLINRMDVLRCFEYTNTKAGAKHAIENLNIYAPEENAAKNWDEATLDQYCDKLETINIEDVEKNLSKYGNWYHRITLDQLEELKSGKVLMDWINEYGIFIILGK